MNWATVRYGGPFRGYMSSVARQDVPRDFLAADSRDLRRVPLDGSYMRRKGTVIVGDTHGSEVGLLEAKFGAVCRQILEMSSDSLSDGLPTHMAIYTDETDKEGCIYFRSSNSTGYNHVLGKTYDTTNHYPVSDGANNDAGVIEHKWQVLWTENATTALTRGTSSTQRKVVGAGTRRGLNAGKSFLAPSLQGTPLEWYQRRFNDTTASGTEPEIVRPWGHYPPLISPGFFTADLPTATTSTRPWKEGDQFFVSVQFVFEDGSVSQPYQSRLKFDAVVSGQYTNEFGLVTVPSTTANTDYYDYLKVSYIPIGPPGCIGRRLLRTRKVDSNAGEIPDTSQFYFWEYIADNTSTTLLARNGNDASLQNPALWPDIHFRHAWPMRGRYVWNADGRTFIGYLKENPAAIVITPVNNTGAGASHTFEVNGDADKDIGTNWYLVRVIDGGGGVPDLQLRYRATIPGAPTTVTITCSATKTINDIVDEINDTGGGLVNVNWAAQLAPGANGNAPATSLGFTSGYDFGDDTGIVSDGTTGNMRGFNNALPVVLYFSQTYMASRPTYKDRFIHTEAGPALKATGNYGNAFNFCVSGPGWMPQVPSDVGILMGGWGLADGCVIFYSKAVFLYRNVKGGRSGEDQDYRLDKISDKGCIAWDSITGGDNWAGWLADDGYNVTDGTPNSEHVITHAIFNPDTLDGDIGYEVIQCRKAVAKDSDDARFSAMVADSRLYISFRASGSSTKPDRQMEYCFSETAGASGLAQVLSPEGDAYGWSAPFRFNCGTMGVVRKDTGLVKLTANEQSSSGYSTGDGRIDKFDSGSDDNGTAINALAYGRTDDFEQSGRRHRCRWLRVKHQVPSSGNITLTLTLYRDQARTGGSATTYTLSQTGTALYSLDVKRVKHLSQTPSKVYEWKIADDSDGGEWKLWYVEEEVRLLETRG